MKGERYDSTQKRSTSKVLEADALTTRRQKLMSRHERIRENKPEPFVTYCVLLKRKEKS